MVYETAGLIALLSIVIIYLQLRRGKNKPEDNRLEAQTVELRQINQQLQQANNLFTAFIVQILARFKQTEAELKAATTENDSLKQTVHKLQQQLASVESERDEVRKISTSLRIENIYFEQKIEQLEAHKKVLIQELGGSISSQDIEFITWEFLIEKVKEVTRQLNEVIAQNQSLIQTNRDLQQERDVLRRELNQVKDNNTRLTQDNLELRASKNSLESEISRVQDRLQPLEIDNNQLEQEKTQLERKLYELNSLNSNSRQLETQVKQLEENARELEKAKISLELQLKDEKSRVALLQQEIESLRITTPDEEINRLLAKIAQQEDIIKELREEIESLIIINPDNDGISLLEDYNDLSLLENYNDLVYFVQTSLGTSGIEEGCISLWRMCQKRVKMKKLVKSSNKYKANKMIPSDQQQLKAHLKAVAEILYRNTDPTQLKSFESIEKSLRQKMLSEVGPELGSFFFQQYQAFKQENPEK